MVCNGPTNSTIRQESSYNAIDDGEAKARDIEVRSDGSITRPQVTLIISGV